MQYGPCIAASPKSNVFPGRHGRRRGEEPGLPDRKGDHRCPRTNCHDPLETGAALTVILGISQTVHGMGGIAASISTAMGQQSTAMQEVSVNVQQALAVPSKSRATSHPCPMVSRPTAWRPTRC
jgi:hypothetical protein